MDGVDGHNVLRCHWRPAPGRFKEPVTVCEGLFWPTHHSQPDDICTSASEAVQQGPPLNPNFRTALILASVDLVYRHS